MTFTKEWTTTIPTGKTTYQSSLLDNKIAELQSSGDIISININQLSANQKQITMLWKNESAFNTHRAWLEASGEKDKLISHNTLNNIQIV